MDSLKVFELYSGIGGMHFALKETGLNANIIGAVDINPTANSVYKLNFPDTNLLERNVQGLNEDYFNKLQVDMIMMSPPCQPFTRNGLRKDLEDHRNISILHVINLIPKLKTVKYILLENVLGFECSNVRNELINSLRKSSFIYQEFLLSPDQFSIPNSRLRYYLLAKREPSQFCFSTMNDIMLELPELRSDIFKKINSMNLKYKELAKDQVCFKVGLIVSETGGDIIEDNILGKYGFLLDIATAESLRTCCFTKAYGRYVEGTGSVFTPESSECVRDVYKKLEEFEKGSKDYIDLIKLLKLRYFSPEEVSCLMTFPQCFKFPSYFSNRQKYKLLGNSINVHVVAILTVILVS
ncbi:UNVERIFIED_CONTAM: hypothetical protein PYX00_000147 [Menopon gallinae]|uniref:tRNA (cytosine(38)-C(5))-methyltransferase n=1 Tax=Menopon gallinae TaxID=328185 RepID=A0AAW2I7V1_9NEOP